MHLGCLLSSAAARGKSRNFEMRLLLVMLRYVNAVFAWDLLHRGAFSGSQIHVNVNRNHGGQSRVVSCHREPSGLR